jgi:autotransporter-associated beta strand protein
MQRLPSCQTFASLIVAAAANLCFAPRLASAAILSWDGTGTGWNVASSWSTDQNAPTPDPASPPGASDIASFNISGLNTAQSVNLDAPQLALGLIFNSTGTVLIQSAADPPPALTIGAGGIAHGAGAGADTISAPVILSASQVWINNSSGIFTASGGVNLQANALTIDGAATTTFSSTVSGSGGLTKSGGAALRLNAGNTFTGGLTIHAGPVILGNAAALNSTTPNAVSFDANSVGALTLNGNSVTVSGLTTNATVGSPFVENKSATPATLTVNNSTNNTFAGILQDATGSAVLSLTKTGAGTLTLSGNNSFTGNTLISAGTLVLGSANALGSAANTAYNTGIVSGATLDLGGQAVGSEILHLNGTGIGGNGALANSSANVASLAGSVFIDLPTYVGGNGNITLSGSVFNFTSSLLTKVGNNTLTLSGTTDNSNLTVRVNSGTLVLAKTNDAHNALAIGFGGLTVSGGTAQLAGTGSDQIWDFTDVTVTSGALDTNGRNETVSRLYLQGTGLSGAGALVNNASGNFSTFTPTNGTVLTGNATIGTPNSEITLNNTISGNFALTKVGSGVLYLTGTNSFSGGLNVQNGTLQVSTINNVATNGPLGNNTSVTLGSTGQMGTLNFSGGIAAATNMPFVLATGGTGGFFVSGIGPPLTLNGTISGAGTLRALANTLILGASNTFTGGVIIDSDATLQLANAGALNASAPNAVNMIGGTLRLNGNSVTITGLSSSDSAAVVENGGAAASVLTVENSGNDTFAGILRFATDTLTLRKTGTGTLTLSGNADNVALAVAASNGTLILAKTSSTTPDVHAVGGGGLVVSGGTAQLAGTGGDQIYNFAPVAVISGTLDTNGRNDTFANLSLQGTGISGAGALVNTAAAASIITPTNGTALTGNTTIGVTQSAGSLTLNNAISGNFALTKVGAGTLRLSGNSTFSGGFNLNQGKLLVKSPTAIGTGSLTIASTGTLGIEIDGSANPPIYDHINVVGQLSLSGTLAVSLVGGFTPAAGNSFDILDWGTLTGTFSSIQLPALTSGLQWDISKLYTTGVLSISLPGDYNFDHQVNAADYVTWRKYDGAANQYAVWRENFNVTSSSAESLYDTSAVPEPCSALLMLLFGTGLGVWRASRAASRISSSR